MNSYNMLYLRENGEIIHLASNNTLTCYAYTIVSIPILKSKYCFIGVPSLCHSDYTYNM